MVEIDAQLGLRRSRTQERSPELVGRDPVEAVGREIQESLVGTGQPGERPPRLGCHAVEHAGDVLEHLAVDEPSQKQVALVPEGQLVVEVEIVVAGQQAPGLQLDEGGGDEEELGGDLEIDRLHAVELGQIGVDDPLQRDLVEIDLLAQDQVQEQVEGTLEHRGLHLVGHRRETTDTRVVTEASRLGLAPGRP